MDHVLRLRRARQSGQAMVEFGFIAVIMVFLFFGVLESGLVAFSVGSARLSAGDAARVAAELGMDPTTDTQVVTTVQNGPLGRSNLTKITSIDIYKLYEDSSGVLKPVLAGTTDPTLRAGCKPGADCKNSYTLSGSLIPAASTANWDPASRNVTNIGDFLGVTINYRYDWKSGALLKTPALQLTSSYSIRLEPQVYGGS